MGESHLYRASKIAVNKLSYRPALMKGFCISLKYIFFSDDEHLIQKRFAVHCQACPQASVVRAGPAVQTARRCDRGPRCFLEATCS